MILQARLWLMETFKNVLLCSSVIFDLFIQQIFIETDTALGLGAPAETTTDESSTSPALMLH